MDTSPKFDLRTAVRYTLTHSAAAHDQVDLVLGLFRGAVQIHSQRRSRAGCLGHGQVPTLPAIARR